MNSNFSPRRGWLSKSCCLDTEDAGTEGELPVRDSRLPTPTPRRTLPTMPPASTSPRTLTWPHFSNLHANRPKPGIVLSIVELDMHDLIMANTFAKYPNVFAQEQANPVHFLCLAVCIATRRRRSYGSA